MAGRLVAVFEPAAAGVDRDGAVCLIYRRDTDELLATGAAQIDDRAVIYGVTGVDVGTLHLDDQ